MSAKQRKYFAPKRSGVVMAKRRHYGGRVRRSFGRARSVGGKFGGVLPPLLGGVADSFLAGKNIMGFSVPNGVGATAVGWFMHDQVTRNIGLYQIGASLPSLFGGSSSGGLGHVGQV
jgi:hypothetical protein